MMVAGAAAGCGPSGVDTKALDGTWVRSDTSFDEKQTEELELSINDDGTVDECSYRLDYHSTDPDFDYDGYLEADCEAEKESDGSLRIEFEVTAIVSNGDSVLEDADPSALEFRWDCDLLVEEEELECLSNGGNYYEFDKD
jgi:hypothetical protein